MVCNLLFYAKKGQVGVLISAALPASKGNESRSMYSTHRLGFCSKPTPEFKQLHLCLQVVHLLAWRVPQTTLYYLPLPPTHFHTFGLHGHTAVSVNYSILPVLVRSRAFAVPLVQLVNPSSLEPDFPKWKGSIAAKHASRFLKSSPARKLVGGRWQYKENNGPSLSGSRNYFQRNCLLKSYSTNYSNGFFSQFQAIYKQYICDLNSDIPGVISSLSTSCTGLTYCTHAQLVSMLGSIKLVCPKTTVDSQNTVITQNMANKAFHQWCKD